MSAKRSHFYKGDLMKRLLHGLKYIVIAALILAACASQADAGRRRCRVRWCCPQQVCSPPLPTTGVPCTEVGCGKCEWKDIQGKKHCDNLAGAAARDTCEKINRGTFTAGVKCD